METILVMAGLAFIMMKAFVFLLIAGFIVWLLLEFAGVLFKIFAYGCITFLSLIGLAWLFL